MPVKKWRCYSLKCSILTHDWILLSFVRFYILFIRSLVRLLDIILLLQFTFRPLNGKERIVAVLWPICYTKSSFYVLYLKRITFPIAISSVCMCVRITKAKNSWFCRCFCSNLNRTNCVWRFIRKKVNNDNGTKSF